MRIYNKWYEELWFWIQENIDILILTVIGLVLGILLAEAYCLFLEGGEVR